MRERGEGISEGEGRESGRGGGRRRRVRERGSVGESGMGRGGGC